MLLWRRRHRIAFKFPFYPFRIAKRYVSPFEHPNPQRPMKLLHISLLAGAAFLATVPAMAQDSYGGSATFNETRLANQEEALRALNGRLEQIEFGIRRLEQSLQRVQSDNDARLTKLEAGMAAAAPPVVQPIPQAPAAQAAPAQTPAPLAADTAGTLGALKMQNGKITGGVNKPQSPPLPATPPDYGLTPQEQYERAFNFLRQANYPEAEQAFKAFIDKNPDEKLIDNAKYWYGETLYVRGRFDESAVAFADSYQQNPKGAKAPDSLLKLGMSLAALNKTADACVTLNELRNKYPNAVPTVKSRAEDERARLKCPAK